MRKHFLIILTTFVAVFAGIGCKFYEPHIKSDAIQEELPLEESEEMMGINAVELTATANLDKPKEDNIKEDDLIAMEIEHEEDTKLKVSNTFMESELELLARVIWAEAGSDWITDEHQRAIASVVVNRVNDSRFPSSIKDVIYQPGQYGCVYNGMINQTPNQRAYDNAKYVLENGVTIPTYVVWQAQFQQRNGLYKYIQGHYFCY